MLSVCESCTVTALEAWDEIGERVREARVAAGFSQLELAARVGLDRTALVRIEQGQRHVSALELFRLAEVLQLPLAHLVTRAPHAVTSRRGPLPDDADAPSRERFLLDADLEAHTRDAQWLVEHQLLLPAALPPHLATGKAGSRDAAADLARQARKELGQTSGPLGPLAAVTERFGLYLTVVDRDADGASLLLDGYGVSVIGGRAEPGRRRWTAAHELGHHLSQDAYHSDVGIAASRSEQEQVVDAFASEFLLPAADMRAQWPESGTQDPRATLIDLAGRYRLSWSAATAAAMHLGLVSLEEARRLRADQPTRGDFLARLGQEPEPDLLVGATGPDWSRAVVAGWQRGLLTAARAAELLHRRIVAAELPQRSVQPTP